MLDRSTGRRAFDRWHSLHLGINKKAHLGALLLIGSHNPLYFAGTQATGAYVYRLGAAVDHHAGPLKVGRPSAAGLPVGMADPISCYGTFTANCTNSRHAKHLPIRMTVANFSISPYNLQGIFLNKNIKLQTLHIWGKIMRPMECIQWKRRRNHGS